MTGIFRYRILVLALVLAAVAALPVTVSSQDVSVRSYINAGSLVLNQEAVLNVEVKIAGQGNAPRPELPDMTDWFAFGGSRGSSTSIQMINNSVTTAVTYHYSLIPKKIGLAKLDPVKVSFNGKTYASSSISIEITKSPPAQPQQPQARPRPDAGSQDQPLDIFVRAIPDKRSVYRNQGVTVDYKVYIGVGLQVREYSVQNLPNTAGFWTEEYPIGRPQTAAETYDGRQYQTAVLKRVELFPTQSGEFELDPMQFQFAVRDMRNRSRSRDIFDRFFDDPFDDPFFGRAKNVRVNSGVLKILVKPLPETGTPAGFDGAVGKYRVTADLDNVSLKTNESATLTVTYEGTGNIRLLAEPELNITGDYEIYDPRINEQINRTGTEIGGSKSYEYVIIPRREGRLTIEPVSLHYFDPEAGRYRTAVTKRFNIDVVPGENIGGSSLRNLTRDEVRLVGTDIRFIKESVYEWRRTEESAFSPLFFVLLFTPLLIVGGAFAYSKHLERLNADAGYRRSRRAGAVAAKRLKEAESAMNSGDDAAFYPAVAKALQDYIADKLNIAAAGIVTDELEQKLREREIDPDFIDRYIGCLRTCDMYRFASVDASHEDMRALYDDSAAAITKMEELLKKAG